VTGRPPRAFKVDDAGLHDAPGVAAFGEIDIDAAPSLEATLDAAIRDSQGAFVIDLSGVEFLDSSGLGVLVRAQARLGREDRALAVICPPGPVRRLFEVAGSDDIFVLYSTRDEAAASLVLPD
jgi:anti-sigma B factor antagonist